MMGSPNMNPLLGFGSLAAFALSAVSLLNPELQWDASFFDEPVMLLGFVLFGHSLEERARLKASSDMNELLVEDAQGCEAPIQIADSIARPFVYSLMTLSATTFAFLVSCPCALGLATPTILVGTSLGKSSTSLCFLLAAFVPMLIYMPNIEGPISILYCWLPWRDLSKKVMK